MIITAGKYKGRKITVPDEKISRPTLSKVRMGVFNMLHSLIGDFNGKSFLDAFGGSGIIGLEAISRGFTDVTVFELNKKSAEIIKQNYMKIGLKPNLTIGNSVKLIDKLNTNFDVIYIDPPYKSGIYEEILGKNITGIIILEHDEPVDTTGYTVVKTKNYGGKMITIIKNEI